MTHSSSDPKSSFDTPKHLQPCTLHPFNPLHPSPPACRVPLPLYPFQKQTLWSPCPGTPYILANFFNSDFTLLKKTLSNCPIHLSKTLEIVIYLALNLPGQLASLCNSTLHTVSTTTLLHLHHHDVWSSNHQTCRPSTFQTWPSSSLCLCSLLDPPKLSAPVGPTSLESILNI